MSDAAYKIAISLVNLDGIEYLRPALNSLLASDLNEFEIKLFYWDNGSVDGAIQFVEELDVAKSVMLSETNLGITEPRIRVMDAILAEEKWDLVFEIHSDMLFPRQWFRSLTERLNDRTGILMPFTIAQDEYIYDVAELEALVSIHRSSTTVYNSIAVHPWLLNMACVREVGYYDPAYISHRCEDDDFMFRVLMSRFDITAYKNSIVFHKGQVIRKKHLKRNKNEKIFEKKHGISVARFSSHLLDNGDPRIPTDGEPIARKKKRFQKLFR